LFLTLTLVGHQRVATHILAAVEVLLAIENAKNAKDEKRRFSVF